MAGCNSNIYKAGSPAFWPRKISLLRQCSLLFCLLHFPLWGIDCSCALRRLFMHSSYYSQALLTYMDASQEIPHSWSLSILESALPKSKVFVLLWIFFVLSSILNSTMLRLLYLRLQFVVMLSSKSSQFVSRLNLAMCFSWLTCPASVTWSSPQRISGTWWMSCAPLWC